MLSIETGVPAEAPFPLGITAAAIKSNARVKPCTQLRKNNLLFFITGNGRYFGTRMNLAMNLITHHPVNAM
jgi:hypothetical protein